jgi:heme-degrading monooxygenase HmoA
MVTEIAHLVIKEGQEAEFEKSVALAKPHFLSANGCHGVSLARCIENPQQYQLFVQWETVDHHMVEFRQSENFQKWRELASPHFEAPPTVEHIEDVNI